MTRKDHLRAEGKWEEEGTRYRRSTAKQEEQRRENGQDGYKKDTRFAKKYEKSGYEGAPKKDGSSKRYQEKPVQRKAAPKSEQRPAPKKEFRPEPPRDDAFLPPENLLSGRNPIREAIKSGRDIEKLLVARGDLSGTAKEIISMARDRHIPIQTVERSRLDEITKNHQGMLAFASAYRYYDVEDMLAVAQEKNEAPFLIVLDGVTDPQNLGAIIRTAACVGAHGVIVPERRAVGLTPSAVKASAGAIETVKVARVTNLTRTLEMLKKQGVWLYAADMDGEDYRKVSFSGPMALIVGAEGEGVSRLVLEACDYKVSLPMRGGVGSLNASVAAGILMYAALNGREG
ncbi:MAG: 23S rRNA (guanosine(2251)-2'-O)-methyltransferase RlmB [Clostridia bacterium]|nr:23S rRNA (guanosine(2251)-2'-O)-methyltransferase RlmB [Clostridia bacterium]